MFLYKYYCSPSVYKLSFEELLSPILFLKNKNGQTLRIFKTLQEGGEGERE